MWWNSSNENIIDVIIIAYYWSVQASPKNYVKTQYVHFDLLCICTILILIFFSFWIWYVDYIDISASENQGAKQQMSRRNDYER